MLVWSVPLLEPKWLRVIGALTLNTPTYMAVVMIHSVIFLLGNTAWPCKRMVQGVNRAYYPR